MVINDQEPRYRLLDGTGTVIASFYLDDSDGFNIQEATNNNEITLASDGTVGVPSVDADELVNEKRISVEYNDDGEHTQFPNTVQGLRDALSTLTDGDGATVRASGIYDLGTTGIDIPSQCAFIGPGKRGLTLQVDDGVGVALTVGSSATLRGFSITGDSAGAADDVGIKPEPNAGFVDAEFVEAINMWRNLDVDGHYNSTWRHCFFGYPRTGDGGGDGCAVRVRTTSGGADQTTLENVYIGSARTRGVWVDANTFVGNNLMFEGGSPDRHIYYGGGNDSYINTQLYNIEPTTAGIDIVGGRLSIDVPVIDAGAGVGAGVPPIREQGGPGQDINTGLVSGWGTGMPGFSTGTKVNGMDTENANAETPQETYIPGTFVDFTDTGDSSGDGIYIIDRNGNPVGPI